MCPLLQPEDALRLQPPVPCCQPGKNSQAPLFLPSMKTLGQDQVCPLSTTGDPQNCPVITRSQTCSSSACATYGNIIVCQRVCPPVPCATHGNSIVCQRVCPVCHVVDAKILNNCIRHLVRIYLLLDFCLQVVCCATEHHALEYHVIMQSPACC